MYLFCMSRIYLLRELLLMLFLFVSGTKFCVAEVVKVNHHTSDHFFTFEEIQSFEDATGKLTFKEISSNKFLSRFTANTLNYPLQDHLSSVYWYKVTVQYNATGDQDYLLEFYNHGINVLTIFIPDSAGRYRYYRTGAKYSFSERLFQHKNFEFRLPNVKNGFRTYYFSIRSPNSMNVVVVHKTFNRFIEYALTEYLFFGVFYGIVLIFGFYNIMMYLVIRERHYLYYVLYLFAVGLYQISVDGIAFQYLWPNAPLWNNYAFGTWLFFISIFALLFALDFLQVKAKARKLYHLIKAVFILRIIFYLFCIFYKNNWFSFSIVELIPLTAAFLTGIYIWQKGYKPARFFVLSYAFLYIGFIAKLLVSMGYGWFVPGPLPHYSMSFGFILEMVFLSIAIGDKVRLLKRTKERAQQQMMSQMEENSILKDSINTALEAKVEERTHVIIEKSKELQEKSALIERQNEKLTDANLLLQQQAGEINRMIALLEKDNEQLQTDIKIVTRHRLMSAEVSFEEFSKEYPDKETCFRFLSELKWSEGYQCKKCSNTSFWAGNSPFSRKCSKCKYDESVVLNTVLQNIRIPANKALYIIFLVYSTKGKISSHKLSEIIGIRQNTCLIYSSKIKKVMAGRRREIENSGEKGWSKLLIT